jgi:hypothetical protein
MKGKKYTFTLRDLDAALAEAYAADRGLKVTQLARAALLSDVKRSVNRGHLLDELVRRLRPLLASDAQSHDAGGADALAGPRARAEGAEVESPA